MSANLGTDIDNAQNVSVCIELQNPMLVPLTQVKVLTVVAEV